MSRVISGRVLVAGKDRLGVVGTGWPVLSPGGTVRTFRPMIPLFHRPGGLEEGDYIVVTFLLRCSESRLDSFFSHNSVY